MSDRSTLMVTVNPHGSHPRSLHDRFMNGAPREPLLDRAGATVDPRAMDAFAPINNISLERYAELAAELDGVTDASAQTQKIMALGVPAADWEAAKQGWTARMQDMSNMGQVATRYMQLFNAAVAKTK